MSKKKTKKQQIIECKKANPHLTAAQVAEACGTTEAYVNVISSQRNKEAKEAKSSSTHIVALETKCRDLAAKVSSLEEEKYLYIKRELRLMGIIEYLESKIVQHGATV